LTRSSWQSRCLSNELPRMKRKAGSHLRASCPSSNSVDLDLLFTSSPDCSSENLLQKTIDMPKQTVQNPSRPCVPRLGFWASLGIARQCSPGRLGVLRDGLRCPNTEFVRRQEIAASTVALRDTRLLPLSPPSHFPTSSHRVDCRPLSVVILERSFKKFDLGAEIAHSRNRKE